MAESASNALEVTVSELSNKLRRTVEETFGHVRVRGELGRISRPGSGHIYLDLKDDKAVLSGIIWKGTASRLQYQPEEGLEVIASGKLTTYPGQSRYQIIIDHIEPAGAGALMALLEERRKKLAAEGLFDDNRKQLLPFMPKVIGVITSPTGAVIRDVLHRISDRFPIHVLVWPVRVQGESCGPEVANGIDQLNNLPVDGPLPRPDLLIVARGGGSLEDLWGFNDEALVRAAANSGIPLISAVGHETDWTLIDHAADWRAPTPTAAAERAVPVKAELEATVADLGARLRGAVRRVLDQRRTHVHAAVRGLKTPDMLLAIPRRRFDEAGGRLGRALSTQVQFSQNRLKHISARLSPTILRRSLDIDAERLERSSTNHRRSLTSVVELKRRTFDGIAGQIRLFAIENRISHGGGELKRHAHNLQSRISIYIEHSKERLSQNERLMETLSYRNVLGRGFAVVRNASDKPITGVGKVKAGAGLCIEMQDGQLEAVAGNRPSNSTGGKTAKKDRQQKTDQGSLF